MPVTFTSATNNSLSITSEVVNPSTNEVTLTYRYNGGAPQVQTLPNPTGPAALLYNKVTTNIYFAEFVQGSVQSDSEYGGIYNV